MALVGDVESGIELRRSESTRLPPIWTDNLEESHYAMTRLKNKLKELESLYEKHILRPTLDDSSDEEQQIEILTQEISRVSGVIITFSAESVCDPVLRGERAWRLRIKIVLICNSTSLILYFFI